MGMDLSTGDRVRSIIMEHLGVTKDQAVDTANLADDLGADSLDTVELVMAFEEDMGVSIDDDEYQDLHTVADWTGLIAKKIEAR